MHELRIFIKNGVASIASVGTETGLVALLGWLCVAPAVSYAVVQLVGTTITFVLGKFWAFGAGDSGETRRELARSAGVFAGSLVLNTAVPSFLSYGLGVVPVTAFLASQVLVFVAWNYPARRWWVFRASPAA